MNTENVMKPIILILVILISFSFAQQPWELITKSEIYGDAENLFFLDENSGWLVGVDGVIFYTSNGGAEWIVQRDTATGQSTLKDIYFIDATHGWACGNDGTVLITTDGGSNWTQSANVPISTTLEALDFVNTTTGYACGDGGQVIKTTNGGTDWILLNTPATKDLIDIAFFDANKGFAISNTTTNHVIWTNTGGVLWNYTTLPMPSGSISARMWGCDAIRGSSHGWITGYHGNIFHTTNRGESWTHNYSIYGSLFKTSYDIDFIDKDHGFAAGYDGELYRTSDGGTSWDVVQTGSGQRISKISALDSNKIIVSGLYGQLRKTTDGGNTWAPMVEWPSVSFRAIGIADTSTISAVTFGGDQSFSYDGGNNFTFPGTEQIQTSGNLYAAEFVDAQTGFIGDDDGKIYKTIDGGQSWYLTTNSDTEPEQVKCFYIHDQNNIWAGANSGVVYKSVDVGENWFLIGDWGTGTVYDLHFLTDQTGFGVTDFGSIYKTSDGGQNWVWQDSVGSKTIYSLDFVNDQVAYCCGLYGIVGTTTDGGENWEIADTLGSDMVTLSNNPRLYDIEFVNETDGWVVGSYPGVIYSTTDGGDSWQQYEYTEGANIQTLTMLDPWYGWLGGDNGLLMRYRMVNSLENANSQNIPKNYELKQNYPNPFNPRTKIEYFLNIAGDAELAIFDIQGKKIKTVVKSYQVPGNYRYFWNGENESGQKVSSGTYFYRLDLNGEVRINKMVLLK